MSSKPTALAAYFERTAAIQNKLAQLQQLADDHFHHNPDAIHWGHVGDLGRVEAGLDDLLVMNVASAVRRNGCARAFSSTTLPRQKTHAFRTITMRLLCWRWRCGWSPMPISPASRNWINWAITALSSQKMPRQTANGWPQENMPSMRWKRFAWPSNWPVVMLKIG